MRAGGEGKLEPAPATPGETGNRRRRVPGPVPGGQAPSQAGGQGCQWGRGRKGHTWPESWGKAPPSPTLTLIQGQSYHPLTPTSSSASLLRTYTVSLPRPTRACTPTPRPERIFFFLKGPGGVGWLVVDEVSACTHRGFCLPWRVKPRLSERAPPPKPRPSVLHCPPQTWARGPNLAGGPQPRPEIEQAPLVPIPPSAFASSASSLPTCLPTPNINLG